MPPSNPPFRLPRSLRVFGLAANPRISRGFSSTPRKVCVDGYGWLGRQDSNLGMAESKSAALPLGDAPMAWDVTSKGQDCNPIARRGPSTEPLIFARRVRSLAVALPKNAGYKHAVCPYPVMADERQWFSRQWLSSCVESRSVAQPGRALRSGRRGRRFKSCHSDHSFKQFK